MKCLFAYNPVSGKGIIKNNIEYIVERLSEKFDEIDVYETKKAGDISLLVQNVATEYDVFVFSGGDGTFNEVVNGLAEQPVKPILGYIPTGTVNDIARSMGIKRKIKKALDVIINGTPKKFDLMKVNDKYAFYAVAYGAMTTCSYMADQIAKKKSGKMAYVGYILKHDMKFERFNVEYSYDDVKGQTDAVMIMVINSRSVSSFMLDKQAVLNDGLVDVVIVKEKFHKHELGFFRRLRNTFKAVALFLFGFKNAKKNKNMVTFTTSNAHFKVSDNKSWNFDGEKGLDGEIQLKVLKEEITLIVPTKK